MAAVERIGIEGRMASRWRRRRMCILVAGAPAPAALRTVSASGAFLETHLRPGLGDPVELRHPDAGTIGATVSALAPDGIALAFHRSEASVAFALAAIAADMTRP